MLLEMYVNELVVSVAVGRPGGWGGGEIPLEDVHRQNIMFYCLQVHSAFRH